MNLSIHFGVNKYSTDFYGSGADLRGCVSDAENMYGLAKDLGYQESWMLTDAKATMQAFVDTLKEAAKVTHKGDTVLISYSCHGTQVKDRNRDEMDKLDEAICLHDGLLFDDQFAALLAKFKPGINVNVVSDTCHSEGQIRVLLEESRPKFLKGLWQPHEKSGVLVTQCSVLQFAACRASEVAWDEGDGGAFTKALLAMARSDRKRRAAAFMDAVKRSVSKQTPTLLHQHATRAHRMKTALHL